MVQLKLCAVSPGTLRRGSVRWGSVWFYSVSVEMAHQLLTEARQSIGIGDFRPEKRGPFGTFRVTKFDEAKQK